MEISQRKILQNSFEHLNNTSCTRVKTQVFSVFFSNSLTYFPEEKLDRRSKVQKFRNILDKYLDSGGGYYFDWSYDSKEGFFLHRIPDLPERTPVSYDCSRLHSACGVWGKSEFRYYFAPRSGGEHGHNADSLSTELSAPACVGVFQRYLDSADELHMCLFHHR